MGSRTRAAASTSSMGVWKPVFAAVRAAICSGFSSLIQPLRDKNIVQKCIGWDENTAANTADEKSTIICRTVSTDVMKML